MVSFAFSPLLQAPYASPVPFKYSDLIVLALAGKAYNSKNLTPLAIGASILTGLVHTHHSTLLPFSLLAGFYLTSSRFTKLKADVKATLTRHESSRKGGEGPRNATQVFSNSLTATVLILLQTPHLFIPGFPSTTFPWSDILLVGLISQYAAVCADTWSSELGILSKSDPYLITTLKKCPKGTNGGVSPLGLGVAAAAGTFIGTISSLFLYSPIEEPLQSITLVLFATAMGLFGSLTDSLLGATLQESVVDKERGIIVEGEGGGKLVESLEEQKKKYKVVSGYNILSNNQVNFFNSVIASVVGMTSWYYFFL